MPTRSSTAGNGMLVTMSPPMCAPVAYSRLPPRVMRSEATVARGAHRDCASSNDDRVPLCLAVQAQAAANDHNISLDDAPVFNRSGPANHDQVSVHRLPGAQGEVLPNDQRRAWPAPPSA